MEATRPEPTDLSTPSVGEKRIDVEAEIGVPVATVKDETDSCDIYKLFTRAPNEVSTIPVSVGRRALTVNPSD
jgi:hypothetical protein